MSQVKIIALQTLFLTINYGFMLTFFSASQVSMLPTLVSPARQHADLDIKLLEGLVQSLYTKGIADSTRSAYSTTQCRYLPFCSNFGIAPLPLSEHTLVSLLPTLLTRDYRPTQFPPTYQASATFKSLLACKYPHSVFSHCLHNVTHGMKRSQPP